MEKHDRQTLERHVIIRLEHLVRRNQSLGRRVGSLVNERRDLLNIIKHLRRKLGHNDADIQADNVPALKARFTDEPRHH